METKLAQRKFELKTLLEVPSLGSSLVIAQFKVELRKEVSGLHAVIDAATKQLKKSGHVEAARGIEKGVRQVYASRTIQELKPPGPGRANLAVGAKG